MNDKYAFWRWPRIIREKQEQIERDAKAIQTLKEAVRDSLERHASLR